jgi:hypothetical protein
MELSDGSLITEFISQPLSKENMLVLSPLEMVFGESILEMYF